MTERGSIKTSHLAIVTLLSVLLLCGTFLVIAFREDISAWQEGRQAAAEAKREKRGWEELQGRAAMP